MKFETSNTLKAHCTSFFHLKLFLKILALSFIFLIIFEKSRLNISSPIWKPIKNWNINLHSLSSNDVLEFPIFYISGKWPRFFNNHPIFYTLNYEKGPPSHFVSKITANWEPDDAVVIFEGPKTPKNLGDQKLIKNCFNTKLSYSCTSIRQGFLSRHLDEIGIPKKSEVKINWFNVNNPDIPAEEQPQGVYLNSKNNKEIQDRFIFINQSGIQQTIILKRSFGKNGQLAFNTLIKTISGLRNYNELNTSRFFVDQELKKIQLVDLEKKLNSIEFSKKLSEIQNLLISKISISPQSFETYYHLAGTLSISSD